MRQGLGKITNLIQNASLNSNKNERRMHRGCLFDGPVRSQTVLSPFADRLASRLQRKTGQIAPPQFRF
jgi:hypothetical protein